MYELILRYRKVFIFGLTCRSEIFFLFCFSRQHSCNITCNDDMNSFNHKNNSKVTKPNSAYNTCSITRKQTPKKNDKFECLP